MRCSKERLGNWRCDAYRSAWQCNAGVSRETRHACGETWATSPGAWHCGARGDARVPGGCGAPTDWRAGDGWQRWQDHRRQVTEVTRAQAAAQEQSEGKLAEVVQQAKVDTDKLQEELRQSAARLAELERQVATAADGKCAVLAELRAEV